MREDWDCPFCGRTNAGKDFDCRWCINGTRANAGNCAPVSKDSEAVATRPPVDDRQEVNDLETGDEVPITNGESWACQASYCGELLTGVYLLPRPFPGPFDDIAHCDRLALVKSLIPILQDALKGGARIIKGVGLAEKEAANEQ